MFDCVYIGLLYNELKLTLNNYENKWKMRT